MACMRANPKIYHITHVKNLPQIVQTKVIWSDAKRIELGLDCRVVGMSKIKHRRLVEIEVHCHPGTRVGEYTPFNFCPRSVMLYILHKGNHMDINYTEGQHPMVHLQADLDSAIRRAEEHNVHWAISDRNAGTYLAQFYSNRENLDKIDWNAVAATDFRDMVIKECKQAEFLMHKSFPWELIEKVGVKDTKILTAVRKALSKSDHQPPVDVEPSWYY